MALRNDAAAAAPPASAIPDLIARRLDALPVSGWHRRIVVLIRLGSFFSFAEVALGTLLIPLPPGAWTATNLDKSLLIGAPFAGEMIGAFALAAAADRRGRPSTATPSSAAPTPCAGWSRPCCRWPR